MNRAARRADRKMTFAVFGREHVLESSPPLSVVAFARTKDLRRLTTADRLDLAARLFGQDVIDEWTAAGMTTNQLEEVCMKAVDHFSSTLLNRSGRVRRPRKRGKL